MQLFELWLPLIAAGILIAIAISAWFADHKVIGVWFGFAGLVALLLLIALQIQESIGPEQRSPLESEMVAQRAYLSAEQYTLENFVVGRTTRLRYVSVNTGKTPAYNARFFATVKVFPFPLPKDMGFTPPDEKTTRSKITIHAGASQPGHKDMDAPLTADEFAAVIDGSKSRLYFMGVVRYDDVFKKPHETWFCVSVGGPSLDAILKSESVRAGIAVQTTGLFSFCDPGKPST